MATRREFIAAAGAGAAGLAVGAGATAFFEHEDASSPASSAANAVVPFYGEHQAGIATAAQDRLVFAAFDVTVATKGELRDLFREWTHAAALMTKGVPIGSVGGNENAPPADTGEALGLGPAQLTITFGLGGPPVRARPDRSHLEAAESAPAARASSPHGRRAVRRSAGRPARRLRGRRSVRVRPERAVSQVRVPGEADHEAADDLDEVCFEISSLTVHDICSPLTIGTCEATRHDVPVLHVFHVFSCGSVVEISIL